MGLSEVLRDIGLEARPDAGDSETPSESSPGQGGFHGLETLERRLLDENGDGDPFEPNGDFDPEEIKEPELFGVFRIEIDDPLADPAVTALPWHDVGVPFFDGQGLHVGKVVSL